MDPNTKLVKGNLLSDEDRYKRLVKSLNILQLPNMILIDYQFMPSPRTPHLYAVSLF